MKKLNFEEKVSFEKKKDIDITERGLVHEFSSISIRAVCIVSWTTAGIVSPLIIGFAWVVDGGFDLS